MRVGIIGYGLVGKVVHYSINWSAVIYDPKKGYNDFGPIINTGIVFVCVPTPTKDCQQDFSAVEESLQKLLTARYNGLVVIKSTILPQNLSDCITGFNPLSICHVPEFLNSYNPFEFQDKHIIGAQNSFQVKTYKIFFPNHQFVIVDPLTAAMIKYAHNLHGVLKVTFFHEIFEICKAEGINYRELIRALMFINNNVGPIYTQVYADGKPGFGGTCFPDNATSFVHEYDIKTIEACIERNKSWRGDL